MYTWRIGIYLRCTLTSKYLHTHSCFQWFLYSSPKLHWWWHLQQYSKLVPLLFTQWLVPWNTGGVCRMDGKSPSKLLRNIKRRLYLDYIIKPCIAAHITTKQYYEYHDHKQITNRLGLGSSLSVSMLYTAVMRQLLFTSLFANENRPKVAVTCRAN